MKKILISAYACIPNHGSEEGNGWHSERQKMGLSAYHFAQRQNWESKIKHIVQIYYKAAMEEKTSLSANYEPVIR